MLLLVDSASIGNHPELPLLLSFGEVADLQVEQHLIIVESPGQETVAVLGEAGTRFVSLAPLNQFKRLAAEIAARPRCPFSAEVIERALAFSFVADLIDADAVVSPARAAFGPQDQGLLRVPAILTVPEALAVIGAFVRQRGEVPLGGSPLMVQQRTEVYPLTARLVVPNGQDWWSSCVRVAGNQRQELLSHAEAVFKRIGQALRGRDSVHEALRLGSGRAAVLDALYHLDVVLTSGVGALDALAQVAHEMFGIQAARWDAGWQRNGWRKKLERTTPTVAEVVKPGSRQGAALALLTRTRNSIHGIPLDEYLYVERTGHSSRVEHRVMISRDLSEQIRKVGAPLAPLDQYGIYLDRAGSTFLNVGEFTERLLSWAIEIVGELLGAMLSCPQFPRGGELQLESLEQRLRQHCTAIARVGEYPCVSGPKGIPASLSLHQSVMASLHKARRH
jgi:hypothetical protein